MNIGMFMCRSPYKKIVYEFVPNSPAVPSMSYFEGLWDGR